MNEELNLQLSDADALMAWREQRSAEAFRLLVERHYGWVAATARRQLFGREALSPDVAQDVFTALAVKAHRIHPTCLGGWLHRHTLFCAAKVLRGEFRREIREATGGRVMNENAAPSTPEAAPWEELAPQLDASLQALPEADREALVLRYLRALPLAEVGRAIGISAGSAQKRVERALDRLRLALERRGVKRSAVWLATALAGAEATPARAAVVEKVASQAVASASPATAGVLSWAAATAAVALCAGAGGWLGFRPKGDAATPASQMPAEARKAEPTAEDPFSARLAALLETGRDGLPGLRPARLAAALMAEPDASLPALARYATSHTTDAAVHAALMHRWSLTDVKAAWAHFGPLGGRAADLADGLVLMAHRDPAGAAAVYDSLPDDKERSLARALLAGLGSVNPAFALKQAALLAKKLPPHEAGALLLPLYEAWALQDPRAAAASAAVGDPAFNRRGQPDAVAFARTIRFWALKDPAAAAAFLQEMKPDAFDELRGRARDAAVQAIVETRPEHMAVWLARSRADDIAAEGTMNAGLKSLVVRNMSGIAQKWAAADPAGAQRFAAETPFPVLRRAILLGCAAQMATHDPDAAADFASRQTETTLRYAMQEAIAKNRPPQTP